MSKIIRILSLIFLLSFGLLFYSPQTALAANCNFTYAPSPNQNMDTLKVTITSSGLAPGKYRIALRIPPRSDTYYMFGEIYPTSDSFQFDPPSSITFEIPKPMREWQAGEYVVYFLKEDIKGVIDIEKNMSCKSEPFTVGATPSQVCTTSIPTRPIEPGTNVILHVAGLAKNTRTWPDIIGTGGYNIIINGKENQVYSKDTDNDQDISLEGSFDAGTYLVEIKNRCGWVNAACSAPPRNQCYPIGFKVATKGSDGGGEISPGEVSQRPTCKNLDDPSIIPGDSICTTSQARNAGCTNNAISTAIGCIHTDPAGFTKDFLTFIIGISGGLAFLMMLLGAFQMLTSAGNPETLSAGRDRLTSAVIGLLFVIFAILLLQIIGAGILSIPGFGP